ncbi:MAG: hypothetical protein JL50_09055 [Peptococcaceae bacterium BICA1-7]|nr:MAG: hypothetical protein JL50_09055 [Peptococcaceae bacterium BICA1-7]HBV97209.1 hypothetical protein [Desulfotomaculum sp.]
MAEDLLGYRIRKQFSSIDNLITELVITRKYICSAKAGFIRCREHLSVVSKAGGQPGSDQDFMKSQEQLLNRLKLVEKRIKRQLRESARELGHICSQDCLDGQPSQRKMQR